MIEITGERKTVLQVTALFFILALLFATPLFTLEPGMGPGGHDIRSLFYFWFSEVRGAVFDGRLPLWDAASFAGYPFLSNPQVAFFYPPTWLAILPPVSIGIVFYIIFHLVVAGVGMFWWQWRSTGHKLGALLAGLSFAFAGFAAARLWAGHIGLLATASWLPWMLLAAQWSVQRGTWRAGVVAGAPFALAILAGHTTSLLYLGIIWGVYAVYLMIESKQWGIVPRQFGLSSIAALLLSSAQLVPLIQFILMSSRTAAPSLEFASAFSMPPTHLITFLIPDYFGEPVQAGYWSVPSFDELTYYVGILPILGILLALSRPRWRVGWLVGLLVLGGLLALGSNGFLFPLVYELLPPFRLTRAPGRAAFLVVFAASALLAEGIAGWSRGEGDAGRVLRPFLTTAGVAMIAAFAATGAVFAAQHPTETSGRLWHQLGGWMTALLLLLAGGGLLWAYLREEKWATWAGRGLVLLVIADLWLFGYPLLRTESVQPQPLWSEVAAETSEAPGRVLPWGIPIFEQNGAQQSGLDSIFGYNALEVGANIAFASSIPDPRSTAYDILGARYVVSTVPLPEYEGGERPLTLVAQTASGFLYERGRVLPLARLVYAAEVIPDEAAQIARVHAADFAPGRTLLLGEERACVEGAAGTAAVLEGTAVVQEKRDGYWRIRTESAGPAWLVVSETAYPGWRVTVDGEPVEWVRGYTAVRAVCVPAGNHIVEWQFQPGAIAWGMGISLVGLFGLGLIARGSFFKSQIKK